MTIPDLRDQIQKTLGVHYTLERELGGGGMSRVFVAVERALGRQVVVKVLPTEMAGQVSIERFKREIRLAASLQQANIVPVLSAGDAGGVAYYTMPFVKGESLRARLTLKGALPIAEGVAILRDVARALAFAHGEGVVHRDIKPENILLSGGTAVVTDFGIAKAIVASQTQSEVLTLTAIGLALGTPAYIAPEQAVGESADHRADLYSLGVVAYEMLTGAAPFAGRSSQAMLAAHAIEAPVPVDRKRADVPPRLASLVMRCLAKEQNERPQSATFILEELESVTTPTAGTATATTAKPSIAVLPLSNMSASVDDEYFSDGITEDIIAQLSKIASLKVISRTSVIRYKKTEKGAREIGSELGVSHIVTGSVRRAGQKLRVVAQLIDARSDEHLWAETYDRDLTDVFATQSEVAMNVAGALRTTLTADERIRIQRQPTNNLDAYSAYLIGRFHLARRSVKSLEQATTHFRRAIELDPSYAAPHAGLADAYTLRVVGYGFAATDSFSTAKTMALRAVELNETLAEGHTALGFVHLCFDWDPDAAERSFRRAIDLNPSLAQAHQWLAQVHIARANDREALVAVRRALELDPLSVVTTCEAGWPLSFMGEHAQAAEQFRRALAMDPDFGLAHYNLANTHEELGEVEDAIAAYERAVSLTGGAAFAIARLVRLLASTGRLEEAERYANDVRERAERGETIQAWLASVLDSLGRVDDAVAAFERAIDAREPYVFFAKWRPASYAMTNMPRHPRFPELLSRIRPTESQS